MIDTVALLLADRSPSLRYRALLEVDGAAATDPEVVALAGEIDSSPEVERALASPGESARAMSITLSRLAYLGVRHDHPAVSELAERILGLQRDDGSWPTEGVWGGDDRRSGNGRGNGKGKGKGTLPAGEGYQWRVLQTALPLRGICAVGMATDPRAERAFEWILDRRLDDGAFPYGLLVGRQATSGVAGYRRLPRSEGCRATTTGVLACLAHHPRRRTSEESRAALDLLLQRETREEATLGFEVARLVGVEPARGFATFYAKFDLAFILDVASRIGVAASDPRVADLVAFIEARRGPYGLWEHPLHPHLSRWLTFDLLVSMRRLATGNWTGTDLRSSFRPYPRHRRRH